MAKKQERLVGQAQMFADNPYIPIPTKVIDNYRQTMDNYSLLLDIKLKHEPGQFVQISIPGIGECPISICSYSGENLMLNIRQVGNVTNALAKLRKGDTVYLRGPYGKGYPMKELKGNSIIMVGGGCGVAPLKGIIEYIERNREDFDKVNLYFGFRSPKDILFQREQLEWKKKYHMTVSVDQAPANTCFDGKVGFVTKMLEDTQMDNANKVVFLCGPPRMMQACIDIFKKKGFHEDQLFISAERLMYCAIGKCCHCMIRGKFTCLDGPVFRYDEVANFRND